MIAAKISLSFLLISLGCFTTNVNGSTSSLRNTPTEVEPEPEIEILIEDLREPNYELSASPEAESSDTDWNHIVDMIKLSGIKPEPPSEQFIEQHSLVAQDVKRLSELLSKVTVRGSMYSAELEEKVRERLSSAERELTARSEIIEMSTKVYYWNEHFPEPNPDKPISVGIILHDGHEHKHPQILDGWKCLVSAMTGPEGKILDQNVFDWTNVEVGYPGEREKKVKNVIVIIAAHGIGNDLNFGDVLCEDESKNAKPYVSKIFSKETYEVHEGNEAKIAEVEKKIRDLEKDLSESIDKSIMSATDELEPLQEELKLSKFKRQLEILKGNKNLRPVHPELIIKKLYALFGTEIPILIVANTCFGSKFTKVLRDEQHSARLPWRKTKSYAYQNMSLISSQDYELQGNLIPGVMARIAFNTPLKYDENRRATVYNTNTPNFEAPEIGNPYEVKTEITMNEYVSFFEKVVDAAIEDPVALDNEQTKNEKQYKLSYTFAHSDKPVIHQTRQVLEHLKTCTHEGLRKLMSDAIWANDLQTMNNILETDETIKDYPNHWFEKPVVPLIQSINLQNVDAVKVMLDHGACPNDTTDVTTSPLKQAIYVDDEELVKIFLDKGAKLSSNNSPLFPAIKKNKMKALECILEYDVGQEDATDALFLAIKMNNPTAVQKLLEHEHGANANSTKNNESAIFFALRHFSASIMNLLFENGANKDAVDQKKNSLLCLALGFVSKKDNAKMSLVGFFGRGRTPPEESANSVKIREQLRRDAEKAALLSEQTEKAALLSEQRKKNEKVKFLLEHGVNVNYKDCENGSALAIAKENRNEGAVELLETYGALP